MAKNEGKVDRILRVTAGCVVLSQAFIGLQTPFAYIGLVFIVTGLVGFFLYIKSLDLILVHLKTLKLIIL